MTHPGEEGFGGLWGKRGTRELEKFKTSPSKLLQVKGLKVTKLWGVVF
jgi:hypothetical protein